MARPIALESKSSYVVLFRIQQLISAILTFIDRLVYFIEKT